MRLSFKKIEHSNEVYFEKAFEIYLNSFPSNERQPLDKITQRVETGQSQLFVALNQSIIVGMALLWDFKASPFVLLDYLAIDEAHRGQQVGSSLFQYLVAHLKDREKYMIIEVEDPLFGDNQLDRNKRIQFYFKNGAQLLEHVPYILPSLDNTTPTNMRLMIAPTYANTEINGNMVGEIIQRLYFEVYEKNNQDETLQNILSKLPAKIHFSNTLSL